MRHCLCFTFLFLTILAGYALAPQTALSQPTHNDPYELIAPNGGTLAKLLSGDYVLNIRPPVKVLHGSLTMQGDQGWIYRDEQKAILEGNVTIYDEEKTLVADRVTYLKAERKLILEGNILVNDFERQLAADHVVYWRNNERLEATGHVVLDDLQEDVTLQGNRGLYDGEAEFAEFDDEPVMIIKRDRDQPIVIRSMLMQYDAALEKAAAIGQVSIEHDQTSAYCGSAELMRRDDRLRMTDDPVVVYNDSTLISEIQGDTIQFHFDDKKLQEVDVQGSAIAIHWPVDSARPDSLAPLYNLASGDRITMFVGSSFVEQVVISGNASSVYFPEPSSSQKQDRNDVRGSYISLDMNKGKIWRVAVTGQSVGTYAFPGTVSTAEEETE